MKIKPVMLYLFAALVVPLALWAQYMEEAAPAPEAAVAAPEAAVAAPGSAAAAPKAATAPKAAPKVGAAKGTDILKGAPGWLNAIVKLLSQIGNIFGDATGVRIGGATVSAIAAIVVARLIKDNVPWWIQGLLYGTGGTMFASGGVDVAQLVQQFVK